MSFPDIAERIGSGSWVYFFFHVRIGHIVSRVLCFEALFDQLGGGGKATYDGDRNDIVRRAFRPVVHLQGNETARSRSVVVPVLVAG